MLLDLGFASSEDDPSFVACSRAVAPAAVPAAVSTVFDSTELGSVALVSVCLVSSGLASDVFFASVAFFGRDADREVPVAAAAPVDLPVPY